MPLRLYLSSSAPVIVASSFVCHSANTVSVSASPLKEKSQSSSPCLFPLVQQWCLRNGISATVLLSFLIRSKNKNKQLLPLRFVNRYSVSVIRPSSLDLDYTKTKFQLQLLVILVSVTVLLRRITLRRYR